MDDWFFRPVLGAPFAYEGEAFAEHGAYDTAVVRWRECEFEPGEQTDVGGGQVLYLDWFVVCVVHCVSVSGGHAER